VTCALDKRAQLSCDVKKLGFTWTGHSSCNFILRVLPQLYLQIDDPQDSASVHFCSGVVGTILNGMFAKPLYISALEGAECGGFIYTSQGGTQLGMQILGRCWIHSARYNTPSVEFNGPNCKHWLLCMPWVMLDFGRLRYCYNHYCLRCCSCGCMDYILLLARICAASAFRPFEGRPGNRVGRNWQHGAWRSCISRVQPCPVTSAHRTMIPFMCPFLNPKLSRSLGWNEMIILKTCIFERTIEFSIYCLQLCVCACVRW